MTHEPLSLDQQAQEIIQQSLKQSEQFLSEGRERQAVQEILWLLETVSTAFQGLDTGNGTVQGKYFNKIADDLRRHHKGKILDQVLAWVTTLHGYLLLPHGRGNPTRGRSEDGRCNSAERGTVILQPHTQLHFILNG